MKIESKEIYYRELEEFARGKIREHLQELLEQEVTEWLGRHKSERKINASEQLGYRNGYGKTRRFTLSMGTIEIRRPRVRSLDERFASKVLPLFKRQTQQVRDLIPELYLHGLASGDFELALRGLLGEGAPLSASSLQRLKEKWESEYEQWKSTAVEEKDWAYFWADGIYVKAGLGKEKAALLVVIGVHWDGSKRFLALEAGYRESKESWALVLRELKSRGVNGARLFVGDGNLGLGQCHLLNLEDNDGGGEKFQKTQCAAVGRESGSWNKVRQRKGNQGRRLNPFTRLLTTPWGPGHGVAGFDRLGQDEDRRRSREARFNGHLVKPTAYDTLMQLLALSDDQLKIKTPDSPEQYPSEKRL